MDLHRQRMIYEIPELRMTGRIDVSALSSKMSGSYPRHYEHELPLRQCL